MQSHPSCSPGVVFTLTQLQVFGNACFDQSQSECGYVFLLGCDGCQLLLVCFCEGGNYGYHFLHGGAVGGNNHSDIVQEAIHGV